VIGFFYRNYMVGEVHPVTAKKKYFWCNIKGYKGQLFFALWSGCCLLDTLPVSILFLCIHGLL